MRKINTPINKIRSITDLVTTVLTHDAESRDSDSRLVCLVWWNQAKLNNFDLNAMSAVDFMKLYLTPSSKFANSDVITRARRAIQERREDLRGEKYNLRQSLSDSTKRNIKTLL